MVSLGRELRNDLSNKVREARRVAEDGARKVIESLAVHRQEPWGSMSPEDRKLRNRLRAHGRQLRDHLDSQRGTQSIGHLFSEVAYEHWHGMLFARFLAENDLLLMPNTTTAITLTEVEEIAHDEGRDWLMVVSEYAEEMLPQIFRSGDPALEVVLPPETRKGLEEIIRGLDTRVFTADDSLGWVYQFWQADKKDEINKSENKIGADELPAVTQLFTEDYMVLFLLHNTLGAWWAGKILATRPELAKSAKSEDELRAACKVGDVEWSYLRFVQDAADDGAWRPAAGKFEGWSTAAKDITVLDPCMGSGHFLVFALPILAALRMAEEGLSREAAVDAVLQDNLFGLEIDPRCTQIAAFNLAFASWRMGDYRPLPSLNLACSGLAPNAEKEDWLELAGDDERLRRGMERLYALFKDAPVLGSLINPRAKGGDLVDADFHELQPLLERALALETKDEITHEMVVTARGVAKAAEILAGQFTLVATNVPYLGRGKQDEVLKTYCERVRPKSKADLSTCFIERSLEFCQSGNSIALVTPQNWWFLSSYADYRCLVLEQETLHMLASLGEEAWQSFGDRGPMAALIVASRINPNPHHQVYAIDALPLKTIDSKITELVMGESIAVGQDNLRTNPDCRLSFEPIDTGKLLANFCESWQGLVTSDNPRFMMTFWEVWGDGWNTYISSPTKTRLYGGRENVIAWMGGAGALHRDGKAHNFPPQSALGRKGILLSQVRSLSATIYTGEIFANGSSPVIPFDENILPALWCFISTTDYQDAVRNVDKKTMVTNGSLLKVEFDLAHWQKVATEKYPRGLPKPFSSDPTQWLFNGQPKASDQPLQVAVCRLLGYKWPRQTGSSFFDSPALSADGLESSGY